MDKERLLELAGIPVKEMSCEDEEVTGVREPHASFASAMSDTLRSAKKAYAAGIEKGMSAGDVVDDICEMIRTQLR